MNRHLGLSAKEMGHKGTCSVKNYHWHHLSFDAVRMHRFTSHNVTKKYRIVKKFGENPLLQTDKQTLANGTYQNFFSYHILYYHSNIYNITMRERLHNSLITECGSRFDHKPLSFALRDYDSRWKWLPHSLLSNHLHLRVAMLHSSGSYPSVATVQV